ncbi:Erbin [Bagarius yarrelli]|uniref:Erbin n=1 Tax=Bagarius yarrelli TaxID=175774 RepID=A0A556VXP5_BAGYA|nr:Erbin [Bagarius yarrelli]
MSSKRSLLVRLVPCRCLRGEEETVTSLDYSHCSLEQVPKEIFSFEKTLEELYLDANQIEDLPKVQDWIGSVDSDRMDSVDWGLDSVIGGLDSVIGFSDSGLEQ